MKRAGWHRQVFKALGLTALMTHVALDFAENTAGLVRQPVATLPSSRATANKISQRPSEAIFLLPSPLKSEATYARNIQKQFTSRGIPCYLLDKQKDGGLDSLKKQLETIQAEKHYRAVTVISCTHGNMLDEKTRDTIPDDELRSRWQAGQGNIRHFTFLETNMPVPTVQVMEYFADALGAEKIDWVSSECCGGGMRQTEVNALPKGSKFFALCDMDESNAFATLEYWADLLQYAHETFANRIDGADIMRSLLVNDVRPYTSTLRFGVSGGDGLLDIPAGESSDKGDRKTRFTALLHEKNQYSKQFCDKTEWAFYPADKLDTGLFISSLQQYKAFNAAQCRR